MQNVHEIFLNRCIEIAKPYARLAAPNPSVGALLVYNNKIISEGFTRSYGGNHAEVECINNIPKDFKNIDECIFYVSLEPCNHYGKTPPCTKKIIETGIKKVVIGCTDPNPIVAGKGIEALKQNGVEVILTNSVNCHNSFWDFFQSIKNLKPFVTIKFAQTKNGIIAKQNKEPLKITTEIADRYTHILRSKHQSVMVGANTILTDKPLLDNRFYFGPKPLVVIADLKGKLKKDDFQKFENYIHFTANIKTTENTIVLSTDSFFEELLHHLNKQKINSVWVEGGAILINELVKRNLYNKIIRYTNKNLEPNEGYKINIDVQSPKFSFEVGEILIEEF